LQSIVLQCRFTETAWQAIYLAEGQHHLTGWWLGPGVWLQWAASSKKKKKPWNYNLLEWYVYQLGFQLDFACQIIDSN